MQLIILDYHVVHVLQIVGVPTWRKERRKEGRRKEGRRKEEERRVEKKNFKKKCVRVICGKYNIKNYIKLISRTHHNAVNNSCGVNVALPDPHARRINTTS